MLSFRQKTPKHSYSSFRRRNTKQTLIKMLSSRNEREEKKRDRDREYLKCFCGVVAFLSCAEKEVF